MNISTSRIARLALLSFALPLLGPASAAPSETSVVKPADDAVALVAGAGVGIVKSVIAAGGGQSVGGSISVRGTAGQPLASLSVGSTLRITSGFWTSAQAPPTCFGDANLDGEVNFADITSVLSNFNTTGTPPFFGDANANGTVDFADITAVLSVFNTNCG